LAPHEKKNLTIKFVANDKFDYSTSVKSSDTIKITQKENYKGYFKFPIVIIGNSENISLNYEIEIDKKIVPVNFNIGISTEDLSPVSPLKYNIDAENLKNQENVDVIVYFNSNKLFEEKRVFSQENHNQFFVNKIPTILSPGEYNVEILVRDAVSGTNLVKEWKGTKKLKVEEYKNLNVKSNKFESYFKDVYQFDVKNLGNVKTEFVKQINYSFLKGLFFSTNQVYEKNYNGALIKVNLNEGDEAKFNYSFNYISLYVIFIVLFILLFQFYVRKNSNPLVVDVKFYEINRVEHEGVKLFKVRIGFENIKEEEIDDLKLIFRMPSYLNVKDNSFLLSEPNHVLKGRSQYKLIWDFKRFEKLDSRILGFTLENKRGILGDIKLTDLEFEIKVGGKHKKYFKSLPVIRG